MDDSHRPDIRWQLNSQPHFSRERGEGCFFMPIT